MNPVEWLIYGAARQVAKRRYVPSDVRVAACSVVLARSDLPGFGFGF